MAGRLVASGLESLRRADNSVPAIYYEGFFGVTIGLERMCKLAIVVADYVHRGTFPTDKELKHKYGHDLGGLVNEVRSRITAGQLTSQWEIPSGDEADELVEFLTDFAKLNRYYNLSFLGGGSPSPGAEPIRAWVDLVMKHHPQSVPTASEARNSEMMKAMDRHVGQAFLIAQFDEHGVPIQSFESGAALGLTTEHVRKQGTMMCMRLSRALASALHSLSYAVRDPEDTLPVFSEFFGILLNEDEYLKGRKTFNYPR